MSTEDITSFSEFGVVLSTLSFWEWWSANSGITTAECFKYNWLPFICYCGEEMCEGFCILPREVADFYLERGSIADPCRWFSILP